MTPFFRQRLASEEGTRLLLYDDSNDALIGPGTVVRGHPTIGIGRALDCHGIDEVEAEFLFERDIARCRRAIDESLPGVPLTDGQEFALVSLVFNVGEAGFRSFRRMLGAIQAGNWNLAADELMDSGAARQLPRRYGEMRDAMLGRLTEPAETTPTPAEEQPTPAS